MRSFSGYLSSHSPAASTHKTNHRLGMEVSKQEFQIIYRSFVHAKNGAGFLPHLKWEENDEITMLISLTSCKTPRYMWTLLKSILNQ